MQLHFTVDEASTMVTVELTGTPRPGELQAFASAIGSHVDFRDGMHVLIDARELKSLPTVGELAMLAAGFRRLHVLGTIGRVALVMEASASEQLARLLHPMPGTEPQIAAFATPDEAEQWLRHRRSRPSTEKVAD